MSFKIQSSNKDVLEKLEVLFFVEIEEDIELIFEQKGEYVIEYDPDNGGVVGLVLRMPTTKIEDWRIINTITTNKYQVLNRIAMTHLMCFFESPTDFSNFHIIFDDDVKCDCGGDAVKSTHSSWCSKHE